jgi:V/A-type H+-transporting ATPase subunit K
MCSKRPEEMSKGIIMAIMVEFYAILCLLATFLMLNGLPYEALTM